MLRRNERIAVTAHSAVEGECAPAVDTGGKQLDDAQISQTGGRIRARGQERRHPELDPGRRLLSDGQVDLGGQVAHQLLALLVSYTDAHRQTVAGRRAGQSRGTCG
jgi:hypothetical protein